MPGWSDYQVYCEKVDVENIFSAIGVSDRIDDDVTTINAVIRHAANTYNQYAQHQYKIPDDITQV